MTAAAFLLSILLAGALGAAEPSLTREQQLHRLKLQDRQLLLEQRRATLESHRKELQIAQELLDKGFLSQQRFKQILNSFKEAQLNYDKAEILLEETKLGLLKNAIRLVVVEARKYRAPDGRTLVDVSLENDSDTRAALLVNPSYTADDARTLLRVENIYVSLKNGPIIGEPYELLLPSLGVGERQTLTFRLLQDTESTIVALRYLDARDEKHLILKRSSTQVLPTISSAQFSQTGELNREVLYDLAVERLSDVESSFALAVVGLPQQLDYAFVDQGARVTQVKFAENTPRARLVLEVDIPERLDPGLIGQTRTFFALVTEPAEYARINALKSRYGDQPVPEEEIRQLRASYARLELVPKGIGRLEALIANLYQELRVGEPLDLEIELLNRGSVPVHNVRAALSLPYGWESEVEPALIKVLDPGQRAPVRLLARPPAGSGPGDHELGVSAQGQVGTENIEAPEKQLTLRLSAPADWTGNAVLIGLLVLLLAGLGLASARIARR